MKYVGIAIAIGIISLVGLTSWDRARGKAAVEEMCRKDGGLRINKTTDVRGFLNRECISCFEYLEDGKFEYVDRFEGNWNPSSLYGSGGYFRWSRARQGDPRCTAYAERAAKGALPNLRYRDGLKPDECLAIEKLPGRPKGVVFYQESFRQVRASNGVLLGVQAYVLKDELSGEILATQREYIFTSDLTIALDMSGGGGRRDSDCHSVVGVKDPYGMPTVMIEGALLDRLKKQ